MNLFPLVDPFYRRKPMSRGTTETIDVRTVDRQLLEALRSGRASGISELTESLGVTATAVRQRIERLLESGLVEREKVVSGRGRPTYSYRLTLLGHRRAGADHAELADAMWHEILAIEPETLRDALISRIAKRLGQRYGERLKKHSQEQSLHSRMESLSEVLATYRIPVDVSHTGNLPVIGFLACPHPDLASDSDRRAMCQLEEVMLSEALGSQVQLRSCRLDGESCCQFAPVDTTSEESGGAPLFQRDNSGVTA